MVAGEHQRFLDALGAIERAQRAAISLFLQSSATSDRRLHDHAARVSHLAVSVAILCGVRDPHLATIEYAGLLHHAPATAPAAQPEVEPLLTLDMLKAMPAFTASVHMVEALPRAHEPNPPDGLHTHLFVPFGTRIIAVCDRFDELSQLQEHPLERGEALAEIGRHRGTPYHPETVDALYNVLGSHDAGGHPVPSAAPPRRRRSA
jgi:hypothetical protein